MTGEHVSGQILVWLPWYVMLMAGVVDIVRHAVRFYYRANRSRSASIIVSELFLCVAWSLLIITSGPDPVINRGSVAIPLRTIILIGGAIWLVTNVVDLATSTRAYQSYRIRHFDGKVKLA